MKRFTCVCLALMLMTMGLGCCCWPGYGAMYPSYNPACPGGNCGVGGVGYYPSAAAYSTYDVPTTAAYPAVAPAPIAIAPAPVYYSPYPTTAMNYLPTY